MHHSAYAFSARVFSETRRAGATGAKVPGAKVPGTRRLRGVSGAIALLVLWLVPWIGGAGPALSQQPSFNCATSHAPDEATICGNYALAELDRRLSDLYAAARDRLDPGQQADLKDSQRAWLHERAACKRDVSCITRLYQQRIPELTALAVPSPDAKPVMPARQDDDKEQQRR